jgi:ATP-dependent helicase HrpB
MPHLPIDAVLPDITAHLKRGRNLVVQAAPGAGKTTRIPRALLEADAAAGRIVVLEPRRLAARMAARRIAEEMGETVGRTVGYQVRFDDCTGPQTRIRFVTEGVLTRQMLADPQVRDVGAVILDEFHERHLASDVALALLRRLQRTARPDLKLLVMSATLDAAPVAAFLDDAPIVVSEGREHPVHVEHLPYHPTDPLERLVATAVRTALGTQRTGDVLVFLPGAAEIGKCRDACQSVIRAEGAMSFALHGSLSPAEQDAAVRPAPRRKVIFATNVAESSVTIDGVTAVIDSGLARVAGYSPWSGLPRLDVRRISRASAIQRAGRAGRTQPGICLRLYSKPDFEMRPAFETPEIQRSDLTETVLEALALGATDLAALDWLEAPPRPALDAAHALLRRLGGLDAHDALTEIGRAMLKFPLHPRLARLVVEAARRGFGAAGCTVAALLGERDLRLAARGLDGARLGAATAHADCDALAALDAFREAERAKFDPHRLRDIGVEPGAAAAVENVRRQLLGILNRTGIGAAQRREPEDVALRKSVLAAYPDRVARCRAATHRADRVEVLLPGGGMANLAPTSVVVNSDLIVAIDVERREGGRGTVRAASAIDADWLLEMFFDDIQETDETGWSARTERVERTRRLTYGDIVLEERRTPENDPQRAADALAAAVRAAGRETFIDGDAARRFLARTQLVAECCPEADIPALTEADVDFALEKLCIGCAGFADLRAAVRNGGFLEALASQLTATQRRRLDQLAPEYVTLPSRRRARIEYETGKPPWLASRLQDFFGLSDGPRVADGRRAVTLHLLAPNQRPVQVTTDLKGFWERAYRELRPQLSRRYPRHAWPENPKALMRAEEA